MHGKNSPSPDEQSAPSLLTLASHFRPTSFITSSTSTSESKQSLSCPSHESCATLTPKLNLYDVTMFGAFEMVTTGGIDDPGGGGDGGGGGGGDGGGDGGEW
jgi:hypothetical protein